MKTALWLNKDSILNRYIKAEEVGGNVPFKQTVGVKMVRTRLFLDSFAPVAPPVRPDIRPVGE